MVLTHADDWPIHQTAEPIAHAATDRYFFNGYPIAPGDDRMFALAFGVYPQLGIVDAAFCWIAKGRQVNLHANRWLNADRMDLSVGPVRLTVEEPLHRLRLTVDAPNERVQADIVFTGRSFPIEEPRFTRTVGRGMLDCSSKAPKIGSHPRMVMFLIRPSAAKGSLAIRVSRDVRSVAFMISNADLTVGSLNGPEASRKPSLSRSCNQAT